MGERNKNAFKVPHKFFFNKMDFIVFERGTNSVLMQLLLQMYVYIHWNMGLVWRRSKHGKNLLRAFQSQ